MLSMCIYVGVHVGRIQGTREGPMRQERRGFREEGKGSAEHMDMREGDHWRLEGDRAHGYMRRGPLETGGCSGGRVESWVKEQV